MTAPLPPRAAGEKHLPTPEIRTAETTAGWVKYEGNPVMGGQYGTCFDISVLKEGGTYRMWLSWRPKQSLALVESKDGIHWSEPPQIVLGPRKETGWEDDINRPVVLKREDGYHLLVHRPGQRPFGHRLRDQSRRHRLEAHERPPGPLAGAAVGEGRRHVPARAVGRPDPALPHVVFRRRTKRAQRHRLRHQPRRPPLDQAPGQPHLHPDPNLAWEKHKVTACQVERQGDWYVMFYIGFRDEPHAQIGLARSRDGITNWQRHPANPIIRPGEDQWDHDACYKPYAIFDGSQMAAVVQRPSRRPGADRRGLPPRRGFGVLNQPHREDSQSDSYKQGWN